MQKQINILIIALAVIVSSFILGEAVRDAFGKHRQGIDVKGYAEKTIDSDVVKWTLHTIAYGKTLAEAQHKLTSYTQAIEEHFEKNNIPQQEIQTSMTDTFIHNKTVITKLGDEKVRNTEIDKYEARKTYTITSSNIERTEKAAASIDGLIGDNINLRTVSVEYFSNNLDAVKAELLGLATRNAYERAQTLAGASKSRIKGVLKARQGVFQITPEYATKSSDYGYFDTSSKRKTVKAIAAITFDLGE